MSEAVLFPDGVALVLDHLRDELAGRADEATVVSAIPEPRPERLVAARRLGGVRETLVSDAPQIGVECWAPTAAEAHDLAQLCRALMLAMRGTTQDGVAVYRVSELAGPANLPDPLSDNPRYVFTHQLHLRGVPLEAAS